MRVSEMCKRRVRRVCLGVYVCVCLCVSIYRSLCDWWLWLSELSTWRHAGAGVQLFRTSVVSDQSWRHGV